MPALGLLDSGLLSSFLLYSGDVAAAPAADAKRHPTAGPRPGSFSTGRSGMPPPRLRRRHDAHALRCRGPNIGTPRACASRATPASHRASAPRAARAGQPHLPMGRRWVLPVSAGRKRPGHGKQEPVESGLYSHWVHPDCVQPETGVAIERSGLTAVAAEVSWRTLRPFGK